MHDHGTPAPPADRRGRLLLTALLLPCLLVTLVSLVVLWPAERTRAADADQFVPDAVVAARVVEVREVDCGSVEAEGRCQQVAFELNGGERQEVEVDPGAGQPRLVVGDAVKLAKYVDVAGLETYALVDFQRDRPLLLLGLLTAVVVVAVARWRGLAAILGVGVTAVGVVVFVLPAILEGSSPIAVALTASSALLFVVLYLAHGLSARTSAALVGTLLSLGICAALSSLSVDLTRITGLSSEETVALQGFAAGVDVRELLLCGFVIGALGVLNDVTITQSSAVFELRASDPLASRLAVYRRAMRIGRDHIASSVYTLVFAYAGAALPLLLVFTLLDRPVGQVLTGDLIAVELVRTAVGTIGLVLSVPITTAVASLVAGQAGAQARTAKATTLSR
ncbi:MAG: YibE/F family protein [Mycobacteriales bacterium]|nr:YibE/F family protein [Mycobacteriales bacterium]